MRLCKSTILLCVAVLIGLSCTDEDKGTGTQDSIPPARIADLAEIDPTDTSLTLTWTAPGDDDTVGTADVYDIRYCLGVINDSTWDSSFQVPGAPAPQEAGSAETLLVADLFADTLYHFAVRAVDDEGNWSAMSNDCLARTMPEVDTIAPAAITDLRVVDSSYISITLAWTAPGDDGDSGRAALYDIRYSHTAMTAVNFDDADTAGGKPIPDDAGGSETIIVANLTPGTEYYFAMRTADEEFNWSALSNIVTVTTPVVPDTIPPSPVIDLQVVTRTVNSVTLAWTTPGDDGDIDTAAQYDLRYSEMEITAENFVQATPVSGLASPRGPGIADNFRVPNLQPSTHYYFAIKTADEVPNWSDLSNVPDVVTPDGIAPAVIDDLEILNSSWSTLTITWTATGDDSLEGMATQYDIRHAKWPITEANFALITAVASPPTPSPAGTIEIFTITDLDSLAFYYVAIKTADEGPCWSAISNVVSAVTRPPDVDVPPASIADLRITGMKYSSIDLLWTAPGGDGYVGQAAAYDIRYALSPIMDDTWEFAFQMENEPQPGPAGFVELVTVDGLSAQTTYYFAVKTADTAGNWSPISNSAQATTTGNVDTWQTVFGEVRSGARSIDMSADGGYVVCGTEESTAFCVKLDIHGNMMWKTVKDFSSAERFDITSVAGAADGGCVISYSNTYKSEFLTFPSTILYLEKLDHAGAREWSVHDNWYPEFVWGESVIHIANGGFIYSIQSSWADGYISKVSESGTDEWAERMDFPVIQAVTPLAGGGYGVTGMTDHDWARVNIADVFIVRLDDARNIHWTTTFGEPGDDMSEAILETNDGGLLIAGRITGTGVSGEELFVVKLDNAGAILWERRLPATYIGRDRSIAPTSDGNYIIVGSTSSLGQGGSDIYLMKINDSGDIIWEKTIGSPFGEGGQSIVPAWDGGFVIAGWTDAFGSGGPVVYVVKVNEDGEL